MSVLWNTCSSRRSLELKYYLGLIIVMMALLLGLFAAAEVLEISLLTDPQPWLARGGSLAAVIGVGLLVGDVVLPVPSSLIMMAHGAVFGILIGTTLSLIGSLGAAWFGFWLGRRGGPMLERLVPKQEQKRANDLLDRWGGLAIVVSRPVPILAETVTILAGTSALTWTEISLATLVGSLPAAVIYAVSGALASGLEHFALVFFLVLLVAGPLWLLGRRMGMGIDQEQSRV